MSGHATSNLPVRFCKGSSNFLLRSLVASLSTALGTRWLARKRSIGELWSEIAQESSEST
jgi:hypothetical protein